MRTKMLAGLFAVVIFSLGGGAWAYKAMARNCCYPGSDCCYPGSPCCTDCCYEGSPCCYPGSPCCNDTAATGEAKKADCGTDPACLPACLPDCPADCGSAATEAKPVAATKCDGGKCCGTKCKD